MSSHGSWAQIRELFEAAVEVPASERRQFLRQTCPDPHIRREVRELLAADSAPADRLDEPLFGRLPDLGPAQQTLSEDSIDPRAVAAREPTLALAIDPAASGYIGPYRLLEEIGRGGMSTVYLAQRNDDHFRKRVAIKVIRQGLDSEPMRRRFRQERQILASLEHPNIARLIDGGSTGDGWPYVVMEYVEGLPIDQHCRRQGLALRPRLKLFCQVTRAVQEAHQNLVVHRDIKPSNVLVTREGEPKLLDFGIAKLLNPELSVTEQVSTRASGPLMTAGYASPEQVRGEPITTSSDVYSLGVLLYELLAGQRPYQLETLSPGEVERVVCGVDPPPPSRAVSSSSAGSVGRAEAGSAVLPVKGLGGDLDAIVLQALAKEPARRYGSAEQLANDLERFLDHRPVRARRPTGAYRLGKLIRRNRLASGMVALLLLAALGVMVQSLFLRRALGEARVEKERAEVERTRGEEVTRLLVDLFEVAAPGEATGTAVTAREILDRGAERVEFELGGQPLVKARLLDTMGQAYQKLGLLQQSEGLLQRALETRLAVLGDQHPDVAESFAHLSFLRHLQSRLEEAERLAREALAIRLLSFGEDHPSVASSLNDLAEIVKIQERYEESEALFEQGLEIRRRQLGPDHVAVAESQAELGLFLLERGTVAEAEPLIVDALRIWRQQLGPEHPITTLGRQYLADILSARGELAAAIEVQEEVLKLERRVLGERHPQVARGANSLGWIYYQAGELDAAEVNLQNALSILDQGSPESLSLAGVLSDFGTLRFAQGRLDEAHQMYRRAHQIRRSVLGEGHSWAVSDLHNLARIERRMGDLTAAEGSFRQLLIWIDAGAESISSAALTRFELGRVLLEQGRAAEAEPWLRRGHAELLDDKGVDWAAMAGAELGLCLLALGQEAEAAPLLVDSRQYLKATGRKVFDATLAKLEVGLQQLGCPEASSVEECRAAKLVRGTRDGRPRRPSEGAINR